MACRTQSIDENADAPCAQQDVVGDTADAGGGGMPVVDALVPKVSDRESTFRDEVSRLKQQLDAARAEVRRLSRAHTQGSASAGELRSRELEEFFLLCIKDVRRLNVRRDAAATAAAAVAVGTVPGGCSPRIHSARARRTYTKVADILLASEDVLTLLYERLFAHRQSSSSRHAAEDEIQKRMARFARPESVDTAGAEEDPVEVFLARGVSHGAMTRRASTKMQPHPRRRRPDLMT